MQRSLPHRWALRVTEEDAAVAQMNQEQAQEATEKSDHLPTEWDRLAAGMSRELPSARISRTKRAEDLVLEEVVIEARAESSDRVAAMMEWLLENQGALQLSGDVKKR